MAVLGSDNLTHSTTFKFNINSADRVTIDSDGRLLVGTSSVRTVTGGDETPILLAEGNSIDRTIACINNINESGFAAKLILGKSRGTVLGSTTILQSGDIAGILQFDGADGSNLITLARVLGRVDGTPGANAMPGRLEFHTTAAGASSSTERMRITSTGDLRFNSGFGSVGTAYGCRAWVRFSATGGVISVNGSGNVSSVTRNSTGTHTVNFSTAMPDENYASNITSGTSFTAHNQSLAASSLTMQTKTVATGTIGDAGMNHVSIFR